MCATAIRDLGCARRLHPAARLPPLVCLDETSKQFVAETRAPEPMQPGQPARPDYEYKSNGVADPRLRRNEGVPAVRAARRLALCRVTERHTAIDYARILRDLSDIDFPNAQRPLRPAAGSGPRRHWRFTSGGDWNAVFFTATIWQWQRL